VFLGKTLKSHSASLHPGVQMGAGELNAGGNPAMDYSSIPSRGGVEMLLVASCYRNQDMLWPYGPLGLYTDLTCTFTYMYLIFKKL